jgi:hypothetical protein
VRDFKPGGHQGSSNSSARNSKVGILTNIDEPFKMIKMQELQMSHPNIPIIPGLSLQGEALSELTSCA